MVNVGKYTIHGSLGIDGFLSAFFPASCSDSMLNVLVLRYPEVQAPNDIDYSNLTVLVLKQNAEWSWNREGRFFSQKSLVRVLLPACFFSNSLFIWEWFLFYHVLPILGCFTMFGFPMTPMFFLRFVKLHPVFAGSKARYRHSQTSGVWDLSCASFPELKGLVWRGETIFRLTTVVDTDWCV